MKMRFGLDVLPALTMLLLAGCGGESGPEKATATAAAAGNEAASRDDEPVTSIDQLYSTPAIIGTSPEGAAWSPDGRMLAFLWNDEGRPFRDVWTWSQEDGRKRVTDHAGTAAGPTDAGITEVVWLSDNRSLAYVLHGTAYVVDGNGASSRLVDEDVIVGNLALAPANGHLAYVVDGALWIRDMRAGGAPRVVHDPGHERVSVERYEWSDDGSRIAFVETDNRDVRQIEIHYDSGGESKTHRTTRAFPGDETPKRRVGVAGTGGGDVRWYERPDSQHPVWGFGLSADGRRLFVDSSDFLIKERTVYVYDVASGGRETFFRSTDRKKVLPAWSAAWAPGDQGLVILSDHDGWFHLYHQPDAGSAARQLTSGEWEVASFEVDDRNRSVWFLANEAHRAELQMYRVSIEGGEAERISRKAGTHEPVFSPDFAQAADRFSNDTTPPDLYVQDLGADSEATRVTDSPLPAFDDVPLADVSYVEFESHIDGKPLLGRLSLPRDYDSSRRYPVLMGSVYPNSVRNRWGAGNAIPTWGLDQHLVERGYVLMKVDTRGSWGHGKEIRQGQFRDYGGIDKDDVQSGAMYLVDAGTADPERIGIFGWSYGGLMTLMSLFHKPDFYAAGIADAPATNVAHAFPEQMWVMGLPEGEGFPERYERMSALYHSKGLSKPLMITHATKDDVVLYGDTIALAERMIAGGKAFELVTMPGSSHVWASDNADQQRFGYRKMVEFFDRHLRPGGK